MAGGVKIGFEAITAIFKHTLESPGFGNVMKAVKIISAGNGRCVAEMTVDENHQNPGGTLHGGLTATLVDQISTFAVMTTGTGAPGVSVDIHVSYLKGAPVGEEIVIDANTLRVGRRLAFLDVDIKKKSTGELLAKGSHTKFVG